ncbi:hypothetical protein QAD02_016987 [Eretmocerus hayati]|uniref:Uncharacterized protein n=1 Tax=Eretmocerus hayati TaxID=131215 RepID=A0ACC2PCR2_9HYME|nr:hypothetical protein QAD02_016987 [Eretmocerus hayati]
MPANITCGNGLSVFHKHYKDHFHGWISLIVCLFGLISNGLNVVVLTRREMRSPTNVILTGLAVTDMMLMTEYLPYAIHSYLYKRPKQETFTYSWAVFVLFHSYFGQVFHTISICLTVTLAVWRYIAVAHPQRNRDWCSYKRTKWAIIAAYTFCPLLCLPLYLTTQMVSRSVTMNSTVTASQNVTLYYVTLMTDGKDDGMPRVNMWVYSVVIKLIPCAALTYFSYKLILALIAARKRRDKLTASGIKIEILELSSVLEERDKMGCKRKRRASKLMQIDKEKQTDRTTKMLLAVLLLFLVTELPQGMLGLLSVWSKDFFTTCYIKLGTDQRNSHSPSAQTFNTPISHDSNSIRSNIDYKPCIYEMIPSQTPDGPEAERRGTGELNESFQDVCMAMYHIDVHLVEQEAVRLVAEMQSIENHLESVERFWEDATQQRLRNLRSREDESQQLRLQLAKLSSITSSFIKNDVERFEQSSQAQTVENPHPLHIQVDNSINTQTTQQSHASHLLEQHIVEIEQQLAELDGLISERVKILHFCEGSKDSAIPQVSSPLSENSITSCSHRLDDTDLWPQYHLHTLSQAHTVSESASFMTTCVPQNISEHSHMHRSLITAGRCVITDQFLLSPRKHRVRYLESRDSLGYWEYIRLRHKTDFRWHRRTKFRIRFLFGKKYQKSSKPRQKRFCQKSFDYRFQLILSIQRCWKRWFSEDIRISGWRADWIRSVAHTGICRRLPELGDAEISDAETGLGKRDRR